MIPVTHRLTMSPGIGNRGSTGISVLPTGDYNSTGCQADDPARMIAARISNQPHHSRRLGFLTASPPYRQADRQRRPGATSRARMICVNRAPPPFRRRANRPTRRLYLALHWAILAASAGCATVPDADHAPLTAEQRTLNVESFDYVWTTIADKHFDPSLNGADWPGVRRDLRPQVVQATTMSDARALMNQMIAALGQSHFAIVPRNLYDDLENKTESNSRDGTCGLDLRLLDGRLIVTQVRPNSAAAATGIRPGWILTRIHETELSTLLEKGADADLDPSEARYLIVRSVGRRLRGPVGRTLSLEFLDGSDRTVERTLTLRQAEGTRVKFGHMPVHYVRFESRQIEPDIGYITFSSWFDPVNVMKSLRDSVASFARAKGVILDLRGNPGGIGAMAPGAAGLFIDEKNRFLGTMKTRQTELRFVVNPQVIQYSGPLALLIDERSASTTEIFASGMQDLNRARIFGSTSAGAALPSTFERLPNGDGFQYAFADYTTAQGTMLEGHGVIPDEPVRHTRSALLEGRDLVLEAAIRWIDQQQTAGQAAISHDRGQMSPLINPSN